MLLRTDMAPKLILFASVFMVGASCIVSTASARGGGITGSQGAGARTGFGPPVGINDQPYHSGGYGRYDNAYPGYYADGADCRFKRNVFGAYPSFVRVCD